MRPLAIGALLLLALAACAPVPTNLAVPPEARPFATASFGARPDRVFAVLRDRLEASSNGYYITGALPENRGLGAIWSVVGGQTVRAYFVLEADAAGGTVARVSTVPGPPTQPERFASTLRGLAAEVAQALALPGFTVTLER